MIVRDVDHLIVRVHDPLPLFHFFTETLGLPVDWKIGGNQAFTSGFAYLGNVSIEFVRFDPALPFALPAGEAPNLGGVVFHPPPIAEALAALDAAGVKCLPPDAAESLHGGEIARWKSVVIPELLTGRNDPFYFLCEYDYDVGVRRAELRARFEVAEGGALGIDRLSEIVIHTPRLEEFRSLFTRLIGPPRNGDLWQAGDGPAIRLLQGDTHTIGPLIFKVRSLRHTERRLDELKLAGGSSFPCIAPDAVGGLDLRFAD